MSVDDILGCPYCRSPLAADQKGTSVRLCSGCGRRFGQEQGFPRLVRDEDRSRLESFAHSYSEARFQDGWRALTRAEALGLPFARSSDLPRLYWRVRAQSFRRLMRVLRSSGMRPERRPVADMGAGNGWLSYRLAQAGYRVLAVDASPDEDWGLGAAQRHYLPVTPFRAVLGDLEHPPLQVGSVILVLFNASLHYARDLQETLVRATEALLPGGRLIIMDSPIARRAVPGTGAGDRHLGRRELQIALQAAGLTARWIRLFRGPAWWVHQCKSWLKGDERFSFPMVVAERVA